MSVILSGNLITVVFVNLMNKRLISMSPVKLGNLEKSVSSPETSWNVVDFEVVFLEHKMFRWLFTLGSGKNTSRKNALD